MSQGFFFIIGILLFVLNAVFVGTNIQGATMAWPLSTVQQLFSCFLRA